MHRLLLLVVGIAVVASGCTTRADMTMTAEPTPTVVVSDPVRVPLSLHVMVEQGIPTSGWSSTRTPDELRSIAAGMNSIWGQAGVVFEPINVHQVEVPPAVLQGIVLGDTDQFFAQVNTTFTVENSLAINGFFVQSAFGVNGFTPQGANLFFVIDNPTVLDERVASHEMGHVLGLRHDNEDASRLMFSGTNGIELTELERTVARYTAEGLFAQGN